MAFVCLQVVTTYCKSIVHRFIFLAPQNKLCWVSKEQLSQMDRSGSSRVRTSTTQCHLQIHTSKSLMTASHWYSPEDDSSPGLLTPGKYCHVELKPGSEKAKFTLIEASQGHGVEIYDSPTVEVLHIKNIPLIGISLWKTLGKFWVVYNYPRFNRKWYSFFV